MICEKGCGLLVRHGLAARTPPTKNFACQLPAEIAMASADLTRTLRGKRAGHCERHADLAPIVSPPERCRHVVIAVHSDLLRSGRRALDRADSSTCIPSMQDRPINRTTPLWKRPSPEGSTAVARFVDPRREVVACEGVKLSRAIMQIMTSSLHNGRLLSHAGACPDAPQRGGYAEFVRNAR